MAVLRIKSPFLLQVALREWSCGFKDNIACPAEITLTPSVGFTPWKGMYDADGAAFTDIALKASKNINITDHFSLPLFVQAIVSPSFDKTYLIAGLSIGF